MGREDFMMRHGFDNRRSIGDALAAGVLNVGSGE
jgi:hypothetical protein